MWECLSIGEASLTCANTYQPSPISWPVISESGNLGVHHLASAIYMIESDHMT